MEHPAQFQQLFTEFQQSYLAVEGFADLAAYIQIRSSAYSNIASLRERVAAGEECTDLILRKLLPYADTSNNRWLGAWTHLAAAVPGDIRRWYGAAGRTGQEDWPVVANAIWRFVEKATAISGEVDVHVNLEAACNEFIQIAETRGFQMGMMTPILNALVPEHFHLVNNRTRHVLQYFTGVNYPAHLSVYPAVNRSVNDFLASIDELIPPFEQSGTHPSDLFERFCYWLTSVRRFSLRSIRYWLIAAGEDSWQWEEWKDGCFVAVGWDELGDLSEIKKAEFTARRDSLVAQYDGWTKRGTDIAWRFARQLQEGDQVAVFADAGNILGYGTVTGRYYYTAELPQSHRVPVQWSNVHTRALPKSLESTMLLMEMDADQFRSIEQSALQTEPAGTTTDENPVPSFISHFAPILNCLRTEQQLSTAELLSMLVDLPHYSERSIHRARHYLSKAGLIESPRRGLWQVTAYGQAISLDEAEMERIYHDVEYRRRVDESLLYESAIIRQLTESATTYTTTPTVDGAVPYEPLTSASQTFPEGVPNRFTSAAPNSDPPVIHRRPDSSTNATPPSIEREEATARSTKEAYTINEWAAETGFDVAELSRWVRTLLRKRQIIISGPSGTGKTYMAHHLARHLCGATDGFWEVVQFHPGYAYEDFIQGLRPNRGYQGGQANGTQQNSSGPPFVMQLGRFLDFCQRAQERYGPAVMIIDEVNRANLARVFGELMYLLEYRDAEVILAGNGKRFRIPHNVYLVGTMNTADRSIALIDHALRRRFGFIELAPNFDVLRNYHARHETVFDIESLIRLLNQVNHSIDSPHRAVGITYFLTPTLDVDLPDIWQTEIEPILVERFFDNPEQAEQFRWSAIVDVLGYQHGGTP